MIVDGLTARARGPVKDAKVKRGDRLRLALERVGLPAWFIIIDLLWVARPDVLGIDARHYQRAAAAWLRGENPWTVTEGGIPYLAGPHTLLAYAPTSGLPLALSTALWLAAGVLAAIWVVRRLRLPIWWVAFPPLAHAIWNGNPQTLVIALLVEGGVAASVLAVALKLYVVVPLLWKPRHLLAAGIALAALLPFVPFVPYLGTQAQVAQHLASAWNGSAWRFPVLLVPTVLALVVLRRRGGEWLALPALWPATQFYYVSTVLPFVARRPAAAAVLALPVPLAAPLVAIAYATASVVRLRPGDTVRRWSKRQPWRDENQASARGELRE